MLRYLPHAFAVALLSLACGDTGAEVSEITDNFEEEGLSDPGYQTPDDPCDGMDNDVDGTVDENCYCGGGTTQPCFPGDPVFAGIGACRHAGVQTCLDPQGDFFRGHWSACVGATTPSPEICGNIEDENCDGFVADCQEGDVTGLPCHPGESQRCYDGPPGTNGIGQCTDGMRFCGEFDTWDPCENSVLPESEICENDVDENCDGADLACD